MIDLYYWTTPNGHKITMFLEEARLPYRLHGINISKGEQFAPDFLAISPNNKIPAIVDHAPADGGKAISVFESGAILLYLAGKTGKFLPKTLRGQVEALEWLMWQMGGLGPMLGQNHHFAHYAPEKIPYAIERYVKETSRLYGVLNKRLADREFLILRLIASGKSVSVIAHELSLSVKTISTYRSRLLEKMGMINNAQLVHYAFQNNLVEHHAQDLSAPAPSP